MTKPAASIDDDYLALACSGSELSHVLSVKTADRLDHVAAILNMLQDLCGQLQTLNVCRRHGAFDHRLRFTGLKPSEARSLATQLAELPGVDAAAVEHQLLQRGRS